MQGLRKEDLEESGGAFVVAEVGGWGVLGLEQMLVWFSWEVDRATAKKYSQVRLGPEVGGMWPEVSR